MASLEAIDEVWGPETDYGTPESWRNNMSRQSAVRMVEMEQLQTAVGPAADLYRAIEADCRTSVAEILGALPETERRALLAAPLAMGMPPLHLACVDGSVQAVEELLDAGASLEVAAPGYGTALHVAAALLEPDIVELLLSRGGPLLCLQPVPCPYFAAVHAEPLHAHHTQHSLRMHAPPDPELSLPGMKCTLAFPWPVAARQAMLAHAPAFMCAGANALALDDRGRDPLEACIAKSHLGSPRSESHQRCISLLEAAVDAAPPELHRARKSNMACNYCGAQGELKRCSGCTLVWYCNAQCIKLAWPTHKQRCKVAQEMRRRLAVLADLTQPSKERVDAMGGVIGSLEAARLAGQLQALKLLEPVVEEDKPTCLGPPKFEQHIPSIMAILEVVSVAGSTPRAWDAPVPLLVQQFCELWLPERLLERLCKEDAPAAELEQALNVFCLLSSCQCGQALPRQLVKCGSALRVARLLCALPWGTADGPSRNMLIYAAGVLGGLLEAERQAPTQQQQQQQRQHRRQQQPGTALEQLLLSEQQLLEACTLAMHVVDSMPMEVLTFLAILYGSAATVQRCLQPNSCPKAARMLLTALMSKLAEAGLPERDAVGIDWLALLLAHKPGFLVQFMPFVKAARAGQPLPHDIVESYGLLLVHMVQQLASALATGRLPDSCDFLFKHMEQLPRKAATLLLALLRDLRGELRAACRAAVTAQQLRAAAAAVERRGDADAAEVARLLRAAAALV